MTPEKLKEGQQINDSLIVIRAAIRDLSEPSITLPAALKCFYVNTFLLTTLGTENERLQKNFDAL